MDRLRVCCINWLRNNFRLENNPCISQAINGKCRVAIVYTRQANLTFHSRFGSAAEYWFGQSVASLRTKLQHLGSDLFNLGPDKDVASSLRKLATTIDASHVFIDESFHQPQRNHDQEIARSLKTYGLNVTFSNATLLVHPNDLKSGSNTPYKVFTPFWRTLSQAKIVKPETYRLKPEHFVQNGFQSERPSVRMFKWQKKIALHWQFGEAVAQTKLDTFLSTTVSNYATARDIPSVQGTSRISPHLRFGELSVQDLWHKITSQMHPPLQPARSDGCTIFLKEVAWREFCYHLLYHFPEATSAPLRQEFQNFPWSSNEDLIQKWQMGQTGYPIVDAGMRELWETGWMHNRVRMIVASFLVKHLLVPWQTGASWFWDTLVDADLANNTMSWQWVAGCGADAAPYFRIFNPKIQGEKFDTDAQYIKHWVPELRQLKAKQIHNLTAELAKSCGYPLPVVDHMIARMKAMKAYTQMKNHN